MCVGEQVETAKPALFLSGTCEKPCQDLRGEGPGGQQQARKVRDFFTALALCHTVIPERFEDTDEV